MTVQGTLRFAFFRIFASMNLRKLSLILGLMAGMASGLSAQLTLSGALDVVEGSLSNPDDNVIAFHWDVVNATDDTLQLMASRYVVQLVEPFNLPYVEGGAGSYERFCWGPLCYPHGTMHSNTANALLVTLEPGETDTTFVGDFYPNGVAGVSAFEYCFYPPGQPDLGACQTTLLCIDAAACALSADEVNLGPEWGWRFASAVPADRMVAIEYTLFPGSPATFELRDLSGAVVKTVALNGGQGMVWLDTEAFADGVYLGAITQDGEVETAKLVIAH